MSHSEKLNIKLPKNDLRIQKKRKLLPVLLISVVLIIMAVSGFIWVSNRSPVIEVSASDLTEVMSGNFAEEISATGRLLPLKTWNVSASTGGRVEEVLVQSGDRVKQSQVLLRLSNPKLESKILESEFQLYKIKAEIQRNITQLETSFLYNQGNLETLRAEVNESVLKSEAENSFYKKGFVSKAQADRFYKKAAALQKKLSHEEERLNLLRALNDKEIKTGQKTLELMHKAHALLLEDKKNLIFRTESPALVTQVYVKKGQEVSASAELMELSSASELKAVLDVPELYSRRLQPGLNVNLMIGHSNITGVIDRISSNVIDGYVKIDVLFNAPSDQSLKSGRFVGGRILLPEKPDQVFIQKRGGVKAHSETYFYKLSKDQELAIQHKVKLGAENTDYILVESGLNPGDIILSQNTEDLKHKKITLRQH